MEIDPPLHSASELGSMLVDRPTQLFYIWIFICEDVKVSRRNARERNRVQSVNHGFDMLKRHIPTAASVKKMSKVNILSHAVNYIEALTSLLRETPPPTHPPPTSSPSTSSTSFPPNPEPSLGSFPQQPCYTSGGASYPPPLTPISPNTHPYYPGFRS